MLHNKIQNNFRHLLSTSALVSTAFTSMLLAATAADAACPANIDTSTAVNVTGGNSCVWTPATSTLTRNVGWTYYISLGTGNGYGGINNLDMHGDTTLNLTPSYSGSGSTSWGIFLTSPGDNMSAVSKMTVENLTINMNTPANKTNTAVIGIEVSMNGAFVGKDVTINLAQANTGLTQYWSYGVLAGGALDRGNYNTTAMSTAQFENLTISVDSTASTGFGSSTALMAGIRAIAQTSVGSSGYDNGSGTVIVSGMTTIVAKGTYSYGVYVSGRNSLVDLNNSSIITSGSGSPAIIIGKNRTAGFGGGTVISRGDMTIRTLGLTGTNAAIVLQGNADTAAGYSPSNLNANFDTSSTNLQTSAVAVNYTINDKGTQGNADGIVSSFNNAVMSTTSPTASLIRFEGNATYAQTNAVFNLRGSQSLLTAASNGWLFETQTRASATANISQGAVVQGMIGTLGSGSFTMNLSDAAVWELVAKDVTTDSTLTALNLASGARINASGGDFQIISPVSSNSGIIDLAGTNTDAGRTLRIAGDYAASGTAELLLNTHLNAGGALADQTTDRLIVNGNVTGSTLVRVNPISTSVPAETSPGGTNLASEGISLIQVGGTASADSFKLAGDYVTLAGQPYEYRMYAYGPGAANGAADPNQNLTTNTAGTQWDYRLQSVYLTPPPPTPGCEETNTCPVPPTPPEPPAPVRVIVPQTAAYLSAPNALFQAGLEDISSLHRRLGEIRDDRTLSRDTGTGEVWIRGYGGSHDYSSNRSPYQYGVNSSMDYAAVQLGGNLFSYRDADKTVRVGLAASFGQLWLHPELPGRTETVKGSADTYLFSAYATYQAQTGWYVDGVIGGGLFNGEVSVSNRGKTASLDGSRLIASLETGYPVALGAGGLILEPQAQLTYQLLSFDSTRDQVDNFDVMIGKQQQLVGRLGARLTRPFELGAGQLLTPYVKANLLYGFLDGGSIRMGSDSFVTGDYGAAVEVGGGATATLTQNLSLYADGAWQTDIGDGGFRGWTVSGGLRMAF